jgi:putative transposase
VAVERSNLRWCSDGFAIGCDNGEKVRVAFALDCCDRAVLGHVATTEGIKGEDGQDLMITAVEYRFGPVNRLLRTVEWLSDNGSGSIAHDTKSLAREIGLEPRTTPVQSHRAMAWPKPSCVRSSAITFASVQSRMRGRCWTAFLYGLSTTTAFTRTRRSGIVHRVSSLPHVNRDDLSDLSGTTTLYRMCLEAPQDL